MILRPSVGNITAPSWEYFSTNRGLPSASAVAHWPQLKIQQTILQVFKSVSSYISVNGKKQEKEV
jgi:hypothetical protein